MIAMWSALDLLHGHIVSWRTQQRLWPDFFSVTLDIPVWPISMFLNCHMHLQWNVVWYGCLIKCLGLCLTIEHAAGLWCLLIDCQLIVCVNALWLVHLNPANEGMSYICCELLFLVICTEDRVTRNVCTCTLGFLSGEANKPLLDEKLGSLSQLTAI